MDFWNSMYSEDYFHFIPDTLANLHEYDWSEDGTFKLDLWSIKSKLFLLKSNFYSMHLYFSSFLSKLFFSFSHYVKRPIFVKKNCLLTIILLIKKLKSDIKIQIDYFAKFNINLNLQTKNWPLLTHFDIWIFVLKIQILPKMQK